MEPKNSDPENPEKKRKKLLFDEVLRDRIAKHNAQLSRILIGSREFLERVLKLGENQTLTINGRGEIFLGKVKTDKLEKLPQKLPGRISNDFDGDGFQEFFQTTYFVKGYDSPKRKFGDRVNIRKFKEKDSLMANFFIVKLECSTPEDISQNFVNSPMGHKYMEVSIKDYPMIGGFSVKTGELHYLKFEEESEIVYVT